MQSAEGGIVTPLESRQRNKEYDIEHFVFEIDFMVKLLRVCVWMPWRKEAMKDVVSCDKLREDANSL